jgi:hypothetical protein
MARARGSRDGKVGYTHRVRRKPLAVLLCFLLATGCSLLTSFEGLAGKPADRAEPSLDGAAVAADASGSSGADGSEASATASACSTKVREGLVGMWRFEDTGLSTVADCTHQIDGMVVGSAPSHEPGHSGSGLALDGNQFVTLGNPTALQITGAITVAAWVKISNLTDSPRIVAKGGASGLIDEALDFRVESTGLVAMGIAITGADSVDAKGGTLKPGVWTHVTGVFRPANDVEVYVDGALGDTAKTNVPASMRDSPNDVWIGRRPGDDCCGLIGVLDDVRIYDRALSAAEIVTIAKE